jgi:TRAP-type C4-dicarboxylate transport system permease small subunit
VTARLPPRARAWLRLVALLGSLGFLAIVMWTTLQSTLTAYRYGRVSTVMLYSLWGPMLIIPLGLALLAMVMLVALVQQVRALRGPRPDEVPPPEASA